MTDAARDWTVYDRAELRAAIGPAVGDRNAGARSALIALDGIHCAACAARAERLMAPLASEVRVNLSARTLAFQWSTGGTRISQILRALDEAGLEPRVLAHESAAAKQVGERRLELARIGVATICAMQVMMLAWPTYFAAQLDPSIAQLLRWSQLLLATPCVLWAGWPFFASAATALRARALNMDVPVALALSVAFAASAVRTIAGSGDLYFDTATMFVWFLGLGRFVEGRTRARASERLRLLAGRRALVAQRRIGALVETVPIESLASGDEVLVPPGEAVPTDGVSLDAEGHFDESLLSGESRPVLHRGGEAVLAGSLNLGDAPVTIRASRTGAETTLAQITRLLDNAQASKPALQLLADRLAGHFVLGVLILAAIAGMLTLHHGVNATLEVALAVLVASCPCALSLAVPVALAAATSRLAAGGVLVANARALTALTRIDTVIVDKTGTLTQAQMSVQQVQLLAELDSRRCLELAAALERGSHHPIAAAFAPYAGPLQATQLRSTGAGMGGVVDGVHYWLGSLEHAPVPLPAVETDAAYDANTWIVLTDETRPLARIAVAAALRPDAPAFVAELQRRGIAVEILSGDSESATAHLAAELGVRNWQARQTPERKLARLRELRARGACVLAVGDGINDAPLLAAADVSAALPRGSALTQSRADLLLLGDRLTGVLAALNIAPRLRSRVRENLLWALAYNLIVLPLAASGLLLPWVAAAGMSLSSLVVVANALRLGPAAPATPGEHA